MVKVSIKYLIFGLLVLGGSLYGTEADTPAAEATEATQVSVFEGPLINAIRQMYKENGMDASHILFGRTEDVRYARGPKEEKNLIAAFYQKDYKGGKDVIVFSPYLISSLYETRAAQKPFTGEQKMYLFIAFYDVMNKIAQRSVDPTKYETLSRDNLVFNKLSMGDLTEVVAFFKKKLQKAPPLTGSRKEFLERITDPSTRIYQRYKMAQNALRNKKEAFIKEVEQKFIEQGGMENIDPITHDTFLESASAARPFMPFYLVAVESYPTYSFFQLHNSIFDWWKNTAGGIYKNPKDNKRVGNFYVFEYNRSASPFPFNYLEAFNSDHMQEFFNKYETKPLPQGNRGFPSFIEIMKSYFAQ